MAKLLRLKQLHTHLGEKISFTLNLLPAAEAPSVLCPEYAFVCLHVRNGTPSPTPDHALSNLALRFSRTSEN